MALLRRKALVICAGSLLAVIGGAFPHVASATLVDAGDIAFIRFNADGFDDFGIVLLADADTGQQVHFNDNQYNSQFGIFGNNESRFTWNVTEALSAGTVVTFADLDTGNSAGIPSHGTISDAVNAVRPMQISAAGETIYAFLGTDNRTPTTFLGAVSTESSSVLDGTGLVAGDTATVLPEDIDEAHYIGPRDTEMMFPDYRDLIGNLGQNWDIRLTDTGTIDPPFQTTNFTLESGTNVPESPRVILLGLIGALGLLGLYRWSSAGLD